MIGCSVVPLTMWSTFSSLHVKQKASLWRGCCRKGGGACVRARGMQEASALSPLNFAVSLKLL